MNLKTDISVGEFLDKVTILEIKSQRILDTKKLQTIGKELHLLHQIWDASPFATHPLTEEIAELKTINEKLWTIEDDIRLKESQAQFDDEFIALARSVYVVNDERATLKRKINIKVGSELVEEKSYADYRQKE